MKIAVIAGNAEARKWINQSRKKAHELLVFVDSETARELLPEENDRLKIFVVKDSIFKIKELVPADTELIIDGSYPYSQARSKRISRMARELGAEYFRLLAQEKTPEGVEVFSTAQEARNFLEGTRGKILVTTDMKTLEDLISPSLHLRLYARVEPRVENLEKLLGLGLGHRQILALSGPFSQEMNQAMLAQYRIDYLVTGESGFQEGVEEKALAAYKGGVKLLVIRDRARRGFYLEELEEAIENLNPF